MVWYRMVQAFRNTVHNSKRDTFRIAKFPHDLGAFPVGEEGLDFLTV